MIDHKTKDRILKKLVMVCKDMTLEFDSNDAEKLFGVNRDRLCSILDYFEDYGLIDQDKYLGGGIKLEILIPAHDLVAHGGFTGKEVLLSQNIKALLLEVESIKALLPDKGKKITQLCADINTGLTLFKA